MNKIVNTRQENLAIVGIVIVYCVGMFGILLPIHPDFVLLTPLNLLVSLGIILAFHPAWNIRFVSSLFFVFLLGFGIEVVGVQTGQIFGEYSYGKTLGFQLFETPLMIGINWLLLVYGTSCIVGRFEKMNLFLRASIAATLMTILDFIIEPVAIKLDFWSWEHIEIPLQNYLAWWGISFVMLLLFLKLNGRIVNKIAEVIFWTLTVFFILLRLFL